MMNNTPSQYLLKKMKTINRSNLDLVMQSLPYHSALSLIRWMLDWLQENVEVELTIKCLNAIMKFHHRQLQADPEAQEVLALSMDLIHDKVKQYFVGAGADIDHQHSVMSRGCSGIHGCIATASV